MVLRLVLKRPNEIRTVWSRTQARNDKWRKGFLELRYSGIFQVSSLVHWLSTHIHLFSICIDFAEGPVSQYFKYIFVDNLKGSIDHLLKDKNVLSNPIIICYFYYHYLLEIEIGFEKSKNFKAY